VTVEVTVRAIGIRGDAIGGSGGQTILAGKALPGEVVEVEEGRLARIVTVSPERIDPVCPHYVRCGGCKLQHWAPSPYRRWKRALVVDALAARGISAPVDELVDAHGAGRRRVTYHVRRINGTWRAGFMEARSHDLCPLDVCPVLVPELASSPASAAAFGPHLGECDVSLTLARNGIDATIKAPREPALRGRAAVAGLLAPLQLARICVNGEVLAAAARPEVEMGGVAVTLPERSFLQATAEGEEALARLVADGVGKAKTVADLFCGLGPFVLRLGHTMKVHAVDSDKPAVTALAAAVRQARGLKPVTSEVRDLFNTPLVASELKEFDAVVFDPPRAGAEAQARKLAGSKVKTVVAVSCDPQTLARDAALLVAGGYAITRTTPVDQFKWSAHVETVMVLKRA
jgi:23S rRNA (uracil1939-C5)-methyltransferase